MVHACGSHGCRETFTSARGLTKHHGMCEFYKRHEEKTAAVRARLGREKKAALRDATKAKAVDANGPLPSGSAQVSQLFVHYCHISTNNHV